MSLSDSPVSPQPVGVYSWQSVGLGAGKSLASDSPFTGLIDDVRIYNRVVKP